LVLPYRTSCNAFEKLLDDYKGEFKNLCQYSTILNTSGVDERKSYRNPSEIKQQISSYAEKGQKSITLTVNRMLKGRRYLSRTP
jgi:hypothetical protein